MKYDEQKLLHLPYLQRLSQRDYYSLEISLYHSVQIYQQCLNFVGDTLWRRIVHVRFMTTDEQYIVLVQNSAWPISPLNRLIYIVSSRCTLKIVLNNPWKTLLCWFGELPFFLVSSKLSAFQHGGHIDKTLPTEKFLVFKCWKFLYFSYSRMHPHVQGKNIFSCTSKFVYFKSTVSYSDSESVENYFALEC